MRLQSNCGFFNADLLKGIRMTDLTLNSFVLIRLNGHQIAKEILNRRCSKFPVEDIDGCRRHASCEMKDQTRKKRLGSC